MTERVNLTNKTVSQLSGAAGRRMVHDRDVRGFCVDVRETGEKTFYFYGRIEGLVRKVKLGTFPEMNCDDARKAARKQIGRIAEGKAGLARSRGGRATLNDLFEHYLTVHAKQKKRTWERDVREFDRLVRPVIGARHIVSIQKADVARLIGSIEASNGKGPARKVRALLHKMFEVAIDDDWIDRNPVRGTHRPDFDPRQRYLKQDEVRAFFEAVSQLRDEVSRDFILLSLFTGQRRSNICSMAWNEIDFDRRIWTIPAAKYKGKRAHITPLTAAAMNVLERRFESRPRGNPWVLPSWGPRGHYANPKSAFDRIRELSGIPDLRLHDLRRTMGAWQQAAGVNLKTIQQTLGHSTIDVTARVYTPTDVAQVQASMEAVTVKMLEHLEGPASKRKGKQR